MIKFFRKLRQRLLTENKFSKYLLYAAGEIVLVVLGILIALQINTWNLERIEARELEVIKNSIASAIRSDIRYLKLIRTGRENIGEKADSIFSTYTGPRKKQFVFNDYAYISNTFNELKNTIYFQPNTSAFEASKNTIYLNRLQGTDFDLLLNSYYDSAKRLQKQEEQHNQSLNANYQAWSNKFRYKGEELFLSPWDYLGSVQIEEQYLKILNDEYSKTLIAHGIEESKMIDLYDLQILLGEKFVEMVEKGEMNFDTQTKIDFSGTFYSYSEFNVLNLLVNGKVPSDFGVIYAQSGNLFYSGVEFEDDAMILTYPQNTFDWGFPYFTINALNNRVKEMDFTKYEKLTLEMKGATGGEQFALGMQDKHDNPDGNLSSVDITLTQNWETYEVPIEQFETADKKIIEVPLGFIFIGDEGRTIYVRSIQFY